jgi:hypothetical protein
MKSKGLLLEYGYLVDCPDRFCTKGYKKEVSLEESLDKNASIDDFEG